MSIARSPLPSFEPSGWLSSLWLALAVLGIAGCAASASPPRLGSKPSGVGEADADGGPTRMLPDGAVLPTQDDGNDQDDGADGVATEGTDDALPGDGADDGAGEGTDGVPIHSVDRELCELEPSQVVVLGDSFFSLDPLLVLGDTQPFRRNLEELARMADALGSEEHYRDYSATGAGTVPGDFALVPSIAKQYEAAHAADPDIKLVIIDGGGNDILLDHPECLSVANEQELRANDACTVVIEKALAAGQKLFEQALADDVRASIYVFYPHLPRINVAGSNPNVILDYTYPRVRELCERQTKATCYFVDLRPAFDEDGNGYPDFGLFHADGVNLTNEGSKVIAREVWKVMQDNCLASE